MMEWIVSPARIAGAAGLLAGYAALCGGLAWRQMQRRRQLHSEQQGEAGALLVLYASQTGQAELLARETAAVLQAAGCAVRLLPVQQLQTADLQTSADSLWLLSTCGEGDAPDHALGFVPALQQSLSLQGHRAQVFALGDSEYQHFCSFGLRVHAWLQAQGAEADLLTMDNLAPLSWQSWQARVAELAQAQGGQAVAWQAPQAFERWTLAGRRHLNPGSQGEPVYLLDLRPEVQGLPNWEAGDLVEVQAPADPEHPREYSIASIPGDGQLQLLVRQSRRADGQPGLASGWLCQGLALGDSLPLRLRAHSGFRQAENAERPMLLIGSGTGLAGLVGHIRARIAAGRSDQWLIFGERSAAKDDLLGPQLQTWRVQGRLEHLDQAWSRDTAYPAYVQQLLEQRAQRLHDWIARDAAIYVCGSLQMGQGVDAMLRQLLGTAAVDSLLAQGRYRRDIY